MFEEESKVILEQEGKEFEAVISELAEIIG
jgi:hypothetical protein